jgi:hypothetical protein
VLTVYVLIFYSDDIDITHAYSTLHVRACVCVIKLKLKQITAIKLCVLTRVPCHHGTARPQDADGGDGLQIWMVAANILNKESWTVDKGWSSSFGVGRGANNPSP